MRISINDVRKAGYCTKGVRTWLLSEGLSVSDFVENGIDVETLGDITDARIIRIIKLVRDRENGHK